MNINRHNYETFFLLYVDKELSAAERKAVDVFVQENPDLQMELVLLQQTVIKAEGIVLDKKDWLYREEEVTALQENLLLYADDELTPADKRSVEALLASDKAARAEWHILQQLKLQPDTTVFYTDKQSLYRKEGGRVVGITWWRVAAAAVLLGFSLWTGVSVYTGNHKKATGPGEMATGNKTRPGQQKTLPANIASVPAQAYINATTENTASVPGQKNNNTRVIENVQSPVDKNNIPSPAAVKENSLVRRNGIKKQDNHLPKPYLENINRNGSNETIVSGVLPEKNNSRRVSGNKDVVVNFNQGERPVHAVSADNPVIKTDQTATAYPVVLVNTKTAAGDDNNRYLNIDDSKEKRTALGGFLRKAKRVLERTTNVKTGDGIKIAGFEIALK